MRIDKIKLTNFRNYHDFQAAFHPDRNIITGENAQGKTNLLESILCLSRGQSPRAKTTKDLINFNNNINNLSANITGDIISRERDFHIELNYYRNRRREISINRVTAKNNTALSEILKTVSFRPEDLDLIRAGASVRRRFLDNILCQLRPAYAAHLSQYQRALDQKSKILRDEKQNQNPAFLSVLPEFNFQIARHGASLIRYRSKIIKKLNEYAAIFHADCSGGRENLNIIYKTSSAIPDPDAPLDQIAESLYQHLLSLTPAERAAKSCLSGPHKDDFLIYINQLDAKSYASQGQARTAALALKLAERALYYNLTGEYPVLLLDDVLSELDPKRREFILSRITTGQVFITCCENPQDIPYFNLNQTPGNIYHIRNGALAL